jgi:iron complex outermembrane recepter protein
VNARAILLLALCASAAQAQVADVPPAPTPAAEPAAVAAPVGDEEAEEEIVVTGSRLRGSVIGDIPPEVTLSPGDIRSYGVSSVAELLTELAPQTGSGQGRGDEAPITLLNGKRISGFAEIRDVPTEAISRVEILPEEVALKYGYRPNQKVVNIVLRPRFRAVTGEVEAGAPTDGGRFSPEVEAALLRIRQNRRVNLALDYEREGAVDEAERGILPDSGGAQFDPIGNIAAAGGGEIDPALSALLGRTATMVGVPRSAATGAPGLGDFVPGTVNAAETGRYRTLLPATEEASANAVLADTIGDDISASVNARVEWNRSRSRQGLAEAAIGLPAGNPFSPFGSDVVLYRALDEFGALGQRSRSLAGHLGTALSGALGEWTWSVTGNLDRTITRTRTERGYDLDALQAGIDADDAALNPYAPIDPALAPLRIDRARSALTTGDAQAVLTGTPFELPAGRATASLTVGGTLRDLASRSTRAGLFSEADLSRETGQGQINIDLPIASRRRDVLPLLGELSLNLNAGHERFSDFGGLSSYGGGVTWRPLTAVTLIASYNREEGAPTIQQLGNPLVTTEGVRVFDYVRGETVDIAQLTGGNPDLRADNRRVLKLGATVRPLPSADLSIVANYVASRIDDPIASFPAATAAIEAAFPDRFERDGAGRLISIDSRAINFARQTSRSLRWGLNFSKQLSSPPAPERRGERERPAGEGPPPGAAPETGTGAPPGTPGQAAGRGGEGGRGPGGGGRGGSGGGRGPGGPGGGFGRGPGGRGTRLQLAVYHTVRFEERIRIYDGGPELDLLKGDAIGAAGGTSRHEVEAQAGLTHNGFGARLSGQWRSATDVNGGIDGDEALRFGDLTTVNLRLFANLGQQRSLVERIPFLRGSRLTLSANNLFNQRQTVRDALGETPVRFQPNYLDPLGRTIRLSFRKLFF